MAGLPARPSRSVTKKPSSPTWPPFMRDLEPFDRRRAGEPEDMGARRIVAGGDGEALRRHPPERIARGVAAGDDDAREAVALDEPERGLAERRADPPGDLGMVEPHAGGDLAQRRRILVLRARARCRGRRCGPRESVPRRGFDRAHRAPRPRSPDRATATPRAARSRRRPRRRRRSGARSAEPPSRRPRAASRPRDSGSAGGPSAGRFMRKRPKP